MRRLSSIFIVLAVLTGLTFCSYESRETTVHEPGVYKGKKDPLLARQQQQVLIDRLKLVQSDR
jgi:hypothetical protein